MIASNVRSMSPRWRFQKGFEARAVVEVVVEAVAVEAVAESVVKVTGISFAGGQRSYDDDGRFGQAFTVFAKLKIGAPQCRNS